MARYGCGTEFIDVDGHKWKIVNYDDTTNSYYVRSGNYHTWIHEDIVADCIKGEDTTMKAFSLKDLSTEELNCLLANVHKEIADREDTKKQMAWAKVIHVIKEYMDEYGDILININDGEAEYSLNDLCCLGQYDGIIMI